MLNEPGAASDLEHHQLDRRRRRVTAAVRDWVDQLIDLTGRNNLLYYRDLKQGTLDLGPADGTVAMDALLGSNPVRLSNLFEEVDLPRVAKRARTIRAKANENFEERGLQTLYLGWGMAAWDNPEASGEPAAPVLLRAAHLAPRGGLAEDFDLSLTGEWEVNPTLLHLLRVSYGVSVDDAALLERLDDDGLDVPDPEPLYSELERASKDIRGFGIEGRLVLGNFSYAKLPMIQDLEGATDALVDNDLICAIAGDNAARQAVRATHSEVAWDEPDHIPPSDEFVVLDADSSQSYVINAVVRGGHLVVEGPPGTGKSQTIANLIATLAARGKRVLFVAEKRAAIEAVTKRLRQVGLEDLVLDLHDVSQSKKQVCSSLARSMTAAGNVPLNNLTANGNSLVRTRGELIDHVEALHAIWDPWRITAYEVQSRLLGLPMEAASDRRLQRSTLHALDNATYASAKESLRRYASLGGLALERGEGPWAPSLRSGAVQGSDAAESALSLVTALASRTLQWATTIIEPALRDCGLGTEAGIDSWAPRIELLSRVAAMFERFDPALYDANLEALVAALAPASRGRFARARARLGRPSYRRARKTMFGLSRVGKVTSRTLLEAATTALSDRNQWRELSGGYVRLRLPDDLATVRSAFDQLGSQVWELGQRCGRGDQLLRLAPDQLSNELDALSADRRTLYRLPELHNLRTEMVRGGLESLLADVANGDLTAERAVECLEHLWLTSIYEEICLRDPRIGAFDADLHSSVVDEFRRTDNNHVDSAASRVLRSVAEQVTEARNDYPKESDLIQHQAQLKRRHLPVRRLFEGAPNLARTLRPCWAMSPLVVAQLLPRRKCFDVVIFDEASQVTPADAAGALYRAGQAVVAGDTHQLPPTSFFRASSGGGEDDEELEESIEDEGPDLALTRDVESVLNVMEALLPAPIGTRTLNWHYRSRDERLIAFSNAQPNLYDWRLTTFPGVAGADSIRHEVIPYRPDRVGQEASVSDEVARVAELVREHAHRRPDESLGVIAMGIKHANRIDEELRLAKAGDADLERFMAEGTQEPIFVKNLERVQGDERDAIILSIGYGKSPTGRMLYRFGPLNIEGGERRLNVAITRARNRLTVVSSFAPADMDESHLRAEGAKMLARYLEYAASGGTDLGHVAQDHPDLNPFERDVEAQLTGAGIPLVPQFGSAGYYIDFAAKHPAQPGRMVLAIECDGATYHNAPTARDRDRLRQEHLERLGWHFHRIWSTDWFQNREAEVRRVVVAYENAVEAADHGAPPRDDNTDHRSAHQPPLSPARGPRPFVPPGLSIGSYSDRDLIRLIEWIKSDTLCRTEEELIAEAMRELGFQRRGSIILERLRRAVSTSDTTSGHS
jgi:very-short-patch-repair endonuclease